MGLVEVQAGVVRGSEAIITGKLSACELTDCKAVVAGPNGRTLRVVPFAPSNVTSSEGEFRVRVPLRGLDAPVQSVYVESRGAAVRTKPDYALARLFFDGDTEFDQSSFGRQRSSRPHDAETHALLARQMAERFDGALETRILMAIAYCYRSVDLQSVEHRSQALTLIKSFESQIGKIGQHRDYQKDRLHLKISMLTARWHVELANASLPSALNTLTEIQDLAPLVKASPLVFTISFNAVRGLATLAVSHLALGANDRALAVIQVMWEVLRAAAMKLGTEGPLIEFASTCSIVGEAGRLNKKLRHAAGNGGLVDRWADWEKKVLSPCFRTSPKIMQECFKNCVHTLNSRVSG
jgi:hypothetical protein